MRCVVLDDYQDVAGQFADWSALEGVDMVSVRRHLADPAEVVRVLRGATVVVVMRERTPLTEAILAKLPDLRLVVTTGYRNASIDLAACRERGITVCGTASRLTPPAELTWALVLGLARHVTQEARSMREGGPWQSTVGRDLAGATFGVIGLGRIGTHVARVAQAFEMDVLAWSPHLTQERAAAAGVRLAPSKRDLMSASDVVSLHLVLSWETRGVIDEGDIAAMRRDAYFVNTARAGLVDNDALVAALQQGRIAGAGLDVFDEEPLPDDHPFRTLPNVLALPHLGYVTAANYRSYFTEAVQDIAAWMAGEPMRVIS
ncbi:MAG TPA: D-2-hydroxyacid dehydrogenase family protein [Nocardioides sp.]|uniref:D-2-hydroxyacid dehydrogenase family protein n=1 Tax=Nocardioides sp. TaxID=35761 RepID=UPI002E3495A4|nr:D-2-hydroxyacid dehydrogenase family protein [Nocardioides sp.]HEX5088729.1 D-2-hydroxyacid dehydrogenase family protein [Nocardioides sp.]